GGGWPLARVQVAGSALAAAVRLNDAAAADWLAKFESALAALGPRDDLFAVFDQLERVLLLAGHLGRDERVPGLIDRLHGLVGSLREEQAPWPIGRLS